MEAACEDGRAVLHPTSLRSHNVGLYVRKPLNFRNSTITFEKMKNGVHHSTLVNCEVSEAAAIFMNCLQTSNKNVLI